MNTISWLKVAAFLAVCFASGALAEDLKTANGKEYKNATVTQVEADGIVVKTKTGISKLYFIELPEDVQKRYHYDPVNAAAAHAAQVAAIQQANQQVEELDKQRREAEQQKALENRLSELQQQKEQLAAQIARPENRTAAQQDASRVNIKRFEAQAREETLGQPPVFPWWYQDGKAYQYAERQRDYEGAKIAAARLGFNSNKVVPPRYSDVSYDPLIRFRKQ